MIAVAITYMPHYARLARAAVLTELPQGLCDRLARRRAPATLRLMLNTVLPNCLAPLIVQATLSFSTAILDAAALGFLGYGAQAPTPEWGTMLADARTLIRSHALGGDASRASPSSSPCWPSTCWATGCAMRSIRS